MDVAPLETQLWVRLWKRTNILSRCCCKSGKKYSIIVKIECTKLFIHFFVKMYSCTCRAEIELWWTALCWQDGRNCNNLVEYLFTFFSYLAWHTCYTYIKCHCCKIQLACDTLNAQQNSSSSSTSTEVGHWNCSHPTPFPCNTEKKSWAPCFDFMYPFK